MRMCRKRTKNLILLITVILILSASLFLTFNQQPTTSNYLTIPTQPTSPISTNSKMGTHLQQLLQTSDPSTEYEMIIFFDRTVNYAQGISLLKNLGNFEIISNYTILDGACIKAPIGMAETIAQQNYVSTVTYNEKIKLAPNQITTNRIQAKDTGVNSAIGATTLQTIYGLNGTGVVVAVLDTGINPHTYLDGSRIIFNMTFTGEATSEDQNGHGTAVAGIIGASGGSAKGVAPAVEFLNLKVLNATGEGESDWLISAIDTALNGTAPKPDIISLSLGDPDGASDDPMSIAVNKAWTLNNTIVVASAGNEGGDFWNTYYETINSPGLGAYIITVGSTGGLNYGSVSYFSSRGPTDDNRSKPDIVAPGENILTLQNDGSNYRSFSGTSASTPVVSGAIALLLDDNSNVSDVSRVSPNTVKAAIMMTANDLGLNPFSQGAGLINIYSAYNYLQGYYNGSISQPPLIITPIRAITPPMTLSNATVIGLNLTIVVGNVTNPIINAYFNVSGNASAYTTLPNPNNFNLNNTQKFVSINFTVPPNMSVSNFSGTLNFVNGTGELLFTIPLSPPSVTPLWIYLLPLLFSSYRTMNPLVIGIVAGIAATVVIALAAIVLSIRRKPEAPPPEFGFEKGEGTPPPPPPPTEPEPEPEPDWFT